MPGVGCLLGQPVESAQLQVVEPRGRKTLDEQVDVPLAGGGAVGVVVEVEAAAVDLAPVGLAGYGLGQREHHLAAVERPGYALAHRAHALVQRSYVAPGGEVLVDESDPVLLACARGGVARGVGQARAAVYLEEEKAVEEPLGIVSVGGDVVGKLLGVPVDGAVLAAVIYEYEVAYGCASYLRTAA